MKIFKINNKIIKANYAFDAIRKYKSRDSMFVRSEKFPEKRFYENPNYESYKKDDQDFIVDHPDALDTTFLDEKLFYDVANVRNYNKYDSIEDITKKMKNQYNKYIDSESKELYNRIMKKVDKEIELASDYITDFDLKRVAKDMKKALENNTEFENDNFYFSYITKNEAINHDVNENMYSMIFYHYAYFEIINKNDYNKNDNIDAIFNKMKRKYNSIIKNISKEIRDKIIQKLERQFQEQRRYYNDQDFTYQAKLTKQALENN